MSLFPSHDTCKLSFAADWECLLIKSDAARCKGIGDQDDCGSSQLLFPFLQAMIVWFLLSVPFPFPLQTPPFVCSDGGDGFQDLCWDCMGDPFARENARAIRVRTPALAEIPVTEVFRLHTASSRVLHGFGGLICV